MLKLKSKLHEEYEMKILEINKETDKKKQEDILTNYMQTIEDELAKIANREPATVRIEIVADGIAVENPYYDNKKNIIKMQYSETVEPLEFLLSLIHESEHANQNLLSNSSSEKSYLYEISQVLYITPSTEGNAVEREYTCNYRELEAKKIEMQFLIELYKQTVVQEEKKKGDRTLNVSDGLKYMRLFNNMNNSVSLITEKEVLKLMNSNLARVIRTDYNKGEYPKFNKLEALKFLLIKAPKYYLSISKEILSLKKELLSIRDDLNNKYKTNLGKTDIYLKHLKEESINKRRERLAQIKNTEKYKNFTNAENFKEVDIFGIENLDKIVQKMSTDSFIVQIGIFDVVEQDIYKLRFTTIEKDKSGDEVLENTEMVSEEVGMFHTLTQETLEEYATK